MLALGLIASFIYSLYRIEEGAYEYFIVEILVAAIMSPFVLFFVCFVSILGLGVYQLSMFLIGMFIPD